MRSGITPIATVAILLPATLIAAVDTWQLEYYGGIGCTSGVLGTVNGPSTPQNGASECLNVPDYGVTKAAEFRTSTTDDCEYEIIFFKDADCQGGEVGLDDGNPGAMVCLLYEEQQSYQVMTSGCSNESYKKARRSMASNDSSTDVDKVSPQYTVYSSTADPKVDIELYSVGSLQFGVASTGAWIFNAAGKCPATATPEDVNQTQCGIAATLAVISGFFSVFQIQGLLRTAVNGKRLKGRSIGAALDDVLNLPKGNTTIIDGLNITMATVDPFIDDSGSSWNQYSWHAVDEDGNVFESAIRLHPNGSSHAVSAVPSLDDDGLDKRASTSTAAWFAWNSGSKSIFDAARIGSYGLKLAAAHVWNYGKSRNVAQHCVDFDLSGPTPKEYLEYGNYALIKGTFTDQSEDCLPA